MKLLCEIMLKEKILFRLNWKLSVTSLYAEPYCIIHLLPQINGFLKKQKFAIFTFLEALIQYQSYWANISIGRTDTSEGLQEKNLCLLIPFFKGNLLSWISGSFSVIKAKNIAPANLSLTFHCASIIPSPVCLPCSPCIKTLVITLGTPENPT